MKYEYTAWVRSGIYAGMVGVGATERRATAEEDVRDWRRDGEDCVLMRREVGEWEEVLAVANEGE